MAMTRRPVINARTAANERIGVFAYRPRGAAVYCRRPGMALVINLSVRPKLALAVSASRQLVKCQSIGVGRADEVVRSKSMLNAPAAQ
jgi:hypothetical protein